MARLAYFTRGQHISLTGKKTKRGADVQNGSSNNVRECAVQVDAESAGLRLLKFVRTCEALCGLTTSKAEAKRAILAGEVLINGAPAEEERVNE